jgi:hypothetical protein
MSDEDDPTLTGADVFGDPVPGEAVTLPDRLKPRDYKTRPRFMYRSDGRPMPKIEPREELETELPDDYYSRD